MSLWNYRVKRKRRRWKWYTTDYRTHRHRHHTHRHHEPEDDRQEEYDSCVQEDSPDGQEPEKEQEKEQENQSHHHHHHVSRRRHPVRDKVFIALGSLMMVLALLVGAGAGGFYYLSHTGKASLLNFAASDGMNMGELQDDEGIVTRNGKKYRYNEDMINILCMGIDKTTEEALEDGNTTGENGQADAIFLLTINPENHTMKLIGISRDTMTEIKTYDIQGNYVGESVNHLGLAYSYGDGGAESGELMVEAVSNLMYELPIHGYAALKLDGIAKLNDAVGGVLVTLPEDIKLAGEEFSKGDNLRLTGEQAYNFIRYRDYKSAGSNTLRMERQRVYALSFVEEAKKALLKRPALAAELYQSLTADMVTSIGLDEAVYLASQLPQISFQAQDIQSLSGTIKQGSKYEEFYVDEEALLDTIFDTFYTEVSQAEAGAAEEM